MEPKRAFLLSGFSKTAKSGGGDFLIIRKKFGKLAYMVLSRYLAANLAPFNYVKESDNVLC